MKTETSTEPKTANNDKAGVKFSLNFLSDGKNEIEKEIQEFLKTETRRQRAYLWGEYCVFTPVVVSKVWGDGLHVIYFGSIDQRPKWWIVRVDSKTNLKATEFDYEAIICAIEDEYGGEELKRNGDDKTKYPAITWGGGHWGTIKNFGAVAEKV